MKTNKKLTKMLRFSVLLRDQKDKWTKDKYFKLQSYTSKN